MQFYFLIVANLSQVYDIDVPIANKLGLFVDKKIKT